MQTYLTLSVEFDYTTLLFMSLAVLRRRIFCCFRALETGGKSGGKPAIWVPLAVLVGGVAPIGGGTSSMNCANVLSLACAISSLSSKHHEVYTLLSTVRVVLVVVGVHSSEFVCFESGDVESTVCWVCVSTSQH